MTATEIIKLKRDFKELSKTEIDFLITGYVKGDIPDYQFSAFLMAAFLNGLSDRETFDLTKSMLFSGSVFNLTGMKEPKIDKHSTGGVGDKTSLILAPIVSAAGIKVPMISGRGLGHTGGTLDKLEAIPGFNTSLKIKQIYEILQTTGAVLVGQTKSIVPADRLIYALRDVTATIESIPLITGSIMSKKLAEDIDGLVLDIKTGSGSFMKKRSDAVLLAESLMNTAKSFGKKVISFITDMNQPLGNNIGNWLEVEEVIRLLQGEYIKNLSELSTSLAGAMIYLGGKADSIEDGKIKSEKLISEGKALDKFYEIVLVQEGDLQFVKNPHLYPKSNFSSIIYADQDGYVKQINNLSIGIASLELGAGRLKKEDKIDSKAGIIFRAHIGNKIKKGDIIAEIFTDKKEVIDTVSERILNAVTLSRRKVTEPVLIKKILK